jgi:ferritin-like metal-binding protein YciE
MKTLAEAFVQMLQDTHYAERALTGALPQIAAAAVNADVRALVGAYLAETQDQIILLERVFAAIGETPGGAKSDAISGLIAETQGIMRVASGVALDASLIAAVQAVAHYMIARYGALREWARVLGHEAAHVLLSQILDMEKAANARLTGLAVTVVNDPGGQGG